MSRIRLTIGSAEKMEPTIAKGTPLGLLGTEAIVRIGPAEINGSATALRQAEGNRPC
jgi:hypothetical protein